MPLASDVDPMLSSAAEKLAVGIVLFLCTTVLSLLLGRFWGYYQARRQLGARHFYNVINVGFTLLDGGALRIRTICESSLDRIYRNRIQIETLEKLAKSTTVENPMLDLPKADAWYYLNFLLNSLSEQFAEGTAPEACGLPVTKVRFSLFLTCEKVGADRLHKIRAMLVRQDLLENFPYHDSMPELEKDYHTDRVVTLRCAARAFREKPYLFLPFDIAL